MSAPAGGTDLVHVVALLGAAIVAVPIFRRLGLGSVLGYLAAGLVVGPYGLKLFNDPQSILHLAELGVVMFLFVIGLEMQPSRLWSMRKQIFGLGSLQVLVCGISLTGVGMLAGLQAPVAFVVAMGFVLTSTAIVMQILDERGTASTDAGQRIVAILLLEDLAIVPLLAIVAFLSPGTGEPLGLSERLRDIGLGLGVLVTLLVVGLWLLNPLFRILARAGARELMTAAALLVVLGAAVLMQLGGLSMAMGAFIAGVLLSESSFRHQLEADIEPFRGLLLGLFFLGVGMALDLSVIQAHWLEILGWVLAFMLVKATGILIVGRAACATRNEALVRAGLMAQGGEFAFVLYAAAAGGLLDARTHAVFSSVVIASMALTPLVMIAINRVAGSRPKPSMDGVERADDLHGSVLVIGFGRFGQILCQVLLARGVDVTIIDNDPDMIRAAESFGSKVYHGDGTRLDVLHASGAHEARAVAVCVDKAEVASRIAELVHHEFPLAKLLVRAFDRGHALKLIEAGVDFQLRETFESALAFGGATLEAIDVPDGAIQEVLEDVRRRDAERMALQQASGTIKAGRDLLRGNILRPTPLVKPQREGRVLSAGARADDPVAATQDQPATPA